MSRLHIFIDGSWLFKACAPERALANRLEYPDKSFRLDFSKLSDALLRHAATHDDGCVSFGERVFSTSIFSLPDNFDSWPDERDDITGNDIQSLRNSVAAREHFTANAIEAGYSDQAIFRPRFKGWMLERLRQHRFQEKQVDATIVALLVRAAITQHQDYHCIITGDADILPAVRIAYPEYSRNVFIATTHPDQLYPEARQTAFSIADFNYDVDPFFLESHAEKIVSGEHVYVCAHCNKVFVRPKPIPAKARACCSPCNLRRT